MRIFALSDLHVDFEENWEWVRAISRVEYQGDVLIVAGDVTHKTERVLRTFDTLRERFLRVFFVPGNHDLWVRGERGNSLEKARCSALCMREVWCRHGARGSECRARDPATFVV